jgi:cell division protein FtsB
MSTPAAGARAAARPRLRFTPRAAVLALVVVALLFYLFIPLKTYMHQRSAIDRLSNHMEQLQQQNARLEAQVRKLNDPAYLEQRARECLGMVRPGEISFIVVPKGGSPEPPNC